MVFHWLIAIHNYGLTFQPLVRELYAIPIRAHATGVAKKAVEIQ